MVMFDGGRPRTDKSLSAGTLEPLLSSGNRLMRQASIKPTADT